MCMCECVGVGGGEGWLCSLSAVATEAGKSEVEGKVSSGET